MDFFQSLLETYNIPLLSAFILGLMTSISPCPLATNITATAFISKNITNKKIVLLSGLMYIALFFVFLCLFISESTAYNFDRLHIFLFNLCSGGTIVLYFTEGLAVISKKVIAFLVLSITYAVFAFFEIYIPILLTKCLNYSCH
mgnify:CR=1 FL=1